MFYQSPLYKFTEKCTYYVAKNALMKELKALRN